MGKLVIQTASRSREGSRTGGEARAPATDTDVFEQLTAETGKGFARRNTSSQGLATNLHIRPFGLEESIANRDLRNCMHKKPHFNCSRADPK